MLVVSRSLWLECKIRVFAEVVLLITLLFNFPGKLFESSLILDVIFDLEDFPVRRVVGAPFFGIIPRSSFGPVQLHDHGRHRPCMDITWKPLWIFLHKLLLPLLHEFGDHLLHMRRRNLDRSTRKSNLLPCVEGLKVLPV